MKHLWKVLVVIAVITLITPIAALAISSPPSYGVSNVDIGTLSSETAPGIAISGWGPIEPDTHEGNWGNIAQDPLSVDKKCRVVWEGSSGEQGRCATITYIYDECVVPTLLEWRALDGSADDSYTITIDGISVYTYTDITPIEDPEAWYVLSQQLPTLPNSKTHIVTICATGIAWASQSTYGQVAFDWINLTTALCNSNTQTEATTTVLPDKCLCVNVAPATLNFGSLYPGTSQTITDALTITNCGDVAIVVTATTDSAFYNANLELEGTSWHNLATWTVTLATGASTTIDARITVPQGYSAGTITGILNFVATAAP